MTLQRLNKTAPSTESLIRIYKGKVVLNGPASRLLGLSPDTLVSVCYDLGQYSARGVKRLYIGVAKANAYKLNRRVDTYAIHSSSLSRSLADTLEGYGTYRICPEDYTRDAEGNKYYNIFFKKYD